MSLQEQSMQPEAPPAAGLGRPEPPDAVLLLTRERVMAGNHSRLL